MSKAIIVIDMPSGCYECPFELEVMVNNKILLNHNICKGCGKPNTDSTKKPDWCPLRPMPEKKEVCGKYPQPDGITPSYKIGYNACIDEIGGIKK